MTSQPGWHPDPVPLQPGQPAQLRYWDGSRWTEHVAPAQAPSAPPATTESTPYTAAPAYTGTYGPFGAKMELQIAMRQSFVA
ncbi:MAG TPA: DUF2510 domain-containing protein, partial [Nocardioides sp.]|nr:DUF2510 domain-containing protein [Nocardioides sp.]